MRDTQRDSKSYMEKRRGRREIEVTRRRGGVKMEESNLASNQFLICSPQSGTPEMFIKQNKVTKILKYIYEVSF